MTSYIHWNPEPEIFTLGTLSIRWYSVLFAAGFIVSYQILSKYFKSEGIVPSLLDSLTIYVVIGTVAGARIGHCLFYEFDYYSNHILEIFLPFKFRPNFEFTGYAGLASHGGASGILIALILFSRKHKVSLTWVLDRLALVFPIAGAFIRFGNLMNSEIIGKPSEASWAFVFERVDLLPRHPGQLYEAILYVMIFVFLNILYHKIKKQHGYIFGLFLVLLFSVRFIIEFVKEPQVDFETDMQINMGQILSIPFILFGFVLMKAKNRDRIATGDLSAPGRNNNDSQLG